MGQENLTEDQIRSVATEINFLRLPLFHTTRSVKEREIDIVEYEIQGENCHIEISHGGNLTAFDRKVLIALEYFYIQQNPLCFSNKILTSFADIARLKIKFPLFSPSSIPQICKP